MLVINLNFAFSAFSFDIKNFDVEAVCEPEEVSEPSDGACLAPRSVVRLSKYEIDKFYRKTFFFYQV
jgi:hypothetical protein